ncbi:DUF2330 domain-containing protein [bacterium]|nr:DUF2330 domain-containing protein [bacterium]
MKKIVLLAILFSSIIMAKPLLKNGYDYKSTIEKNNAFILYLVGSMEMVFGFDYQLEIKNKEKNMKTTDEFYFLLPIPNPLKNWSKSEQEIFNNLEKATKPEGMSDSKTDKNSKKNSSKKVVKPVIKYGAKVQDVFKSEFIGQKAFDDVNKFLKEKNYPEASFDDYKYYIDRKWSFIVIQYKAEKNAILAKGTVEPIYLSLDADMVSFALRVFKGSENFKTSVYILSQFDLDLSDLTKISLTTVELENPKLSQQNRVTIITELGDSVISFYDKIAQENEIFKDMENNNLRLYHIYGKDLDLSKWDSSSDLSLNNK